MNISPQQCRVARAALDWSLNDLAKVTGFEVYTLHRFERGKRLENAEAIESLARTAFESRGVKFTNSGIAWNS